MNKRIALWALMGALVACFWVLLAMLAATHLPHDWGRWPVVSITAPASLVGRHSPQTWYAFVLLNAALYVLAGLATEPLHHLRH